jgi:hypothetical protein
VDDEVFPHELRVGDVVKVAGAEWWVTSKTRMRPGGRSVEVWLEHVKHRDEKLVWPFDQHHRVKRVNAA